MKTRILTTALLLSLTLALAACAGTSPDEDSDAPAPDPGDSPGAGLRLAPGLYELEDGTVQVIGTLVRVDLEGGFWAVVENAESDGTEGGNIAVIANGDELDSELRPLEGGQVSLIGTRFDGMSIRMAGPEVIVDSVQAIDDTPDEG